MRLWDIHTTRHYLASSHMPGISNAAFPERFPFNNTLAGHQHLIFAMDSKLRLAQQILGPPHQTSQKSFPRKHSSQKTISARHSDIAELASSGTAAVVHCRLVFLAVHVIERLLSRCFSPSRPNKNPRRRRRNYCPLVSAKTLINMMLYMLFLFPAQERHRDTTINSAPVYALIGPMSFS